jgi:hypothetical protein
MRATAAEILATLEAAGIDTESYYVDYDTLNGEIARNEFGSEFPGLSIDGGEYDAEKPHENTTFTFPVDVHYALTTDRYPLLPAITADDLGALVHAVQSCRLAARFTELLQDELSPKQLREVRRTNRTPEYQDGSCASHNFCDANEPMAKAYRYATGQEFEPGNEAAADLWSTAWDLAKADEFITTYK